MESGLVDLEALDYPLRADEAGDEEELTDRESACLVLVSRSALPRRVQRSSRHWRAPCRCSSLRSGKGLDVSSREERVARNEELFLVVNREIEKLNRLTISAFARILSCSSSCPAMRTQT